MQKNLLKFKLFTLMSFSYFSYCCIYFSFIDFTEHMFGFADELILCTGIF